MATEQTMRLAHILNNAHALGELEDPSRSTRNIQLVAMHFADEIKESGGSREVLKHSEIPDSLYSKLDDAIRLRDFVQLTEEGHKAIGKASLDS